jgi:hypothetical protein
MHDNEGSVLIPGSIYSITEFYSQDFSSHGIVLIANLHKIPKSWFG